MRRTKSEVLAARNSVAGCCEAFADRMGCRCLEEAEDDRPESRPATVEVSYSTPDETYGVHRAMVSGGGRSMECEFRHRRELGWTLVLPPGEYGAADAPLLEVAIHELKRLNGTLPPVRVGGLRPAKKGPTGNHDYCPTCGERYVSQCRCLKADRRCANGHEWHLCLAHKPRLIVVGPSDHSRPTNECSCPKEGR